MRVSQLHRRTVEKGAPEIIAHVNRRALVIWLFLSGVCVLGSLLPTIGMGILLAINADVRNQSAAAIGVLLIFGSLAAMSIWQTRMFLHLFFLKEPTLIVNHAGIRIGKIYGPADIFLPWKEVRIVYSGPPYKILCIQPIDNQLFRARLSPMMRLTYRLCSSNGAFIALYRYLLDRPIPELWQQVQTHYQQKHRVRRKNGFL